MKKNNLILIKILFCVFFICSSLYSVSYCEDEYGFNNSETWNDEETQINIASKDSQQIELLINSMGNDEDYYSAGIYEITNNLNLEKYSGVWFDIEYETEDILSVQFNISDSNSNNLEYIDSLYGLDQQNNMKVLKCFPNGCVNFFKSDKSRIYIPFSSENITNSSFDFSSITTYGFNFSMRGNKTAKVKISNITWVGPEEAAIYAKCSGEEINGDEIIYIPTVKSIKATYSMPENSIFKFVPISNYPGVSLEDNGEMTVEATASEGKIIIYAQNDDNIYLSFETFLSKSWTTKVDDTYMLILPSEYKLEFNGLNFSKNALNIRYLQIGIICFGIVFFIAYFYGRIIYKHDEIKKLEE